MRRSTPGIAEPARKTLFERAVRGLGAHVGWLMTGTPRWRSLQNYPTTTWTGARRGHHFTVDDDGMVTRMAVHLRPDEMDAARARLNRGAS
jgi:hypothetical protein